ncbi:hypothetical protein COV49_01365 [Candidatus Falkowbacteria bacterium CG11_big_fil_rev_8_21_14_0_20_39_10]|uniref:Methyltransferase domain-containing protein n=1 Tax=Candidatus Falkowbacteria bacterium CG11_big_fil_rev_8_21_14_0_20_39_10 TaxID=1974570 RepID=A0A2M6K9I2_9BACT|nr:MAG: hypothetical protein COV49_01365 [Candidatus Falkowbacteria bacterium CG11_big_fil_rev_8_21_14_0_20_39_10]
MNQKDFWKKESWQYFQRNYQDKDLKKIEPSEFVVELLEKHPVEIGGGSILDIGCGPAHNLHYLFRELKAGRGVGTESSEQTVDVLSKNFKEYEFIANNSAVLPFKTGEFDLVLLRSVLHWIDRNYLLQTLGEAVRVTKKYLIISDFCPRHPYYSIYGHNRDYKTYKISYQKLIEELGTIKTLSSFYSRDNDEWNRLQTGLYEKFAFEEMHSVKSEEDFK